MVGINSPNSSKPSRSDDLGDPEEREQHALRVRAYLAANAPKRPLKPARSDAIDLPSSTDRDESNDSTTSDPPERIKYLQLLANSTPLETRGSGEVSDDYTESQYYQYMAAIAKDHHTIGTGFIKVDNSTLTEGFQLSPQFQPSPSLRRRHRCNPAMNDCWDSSPHTSLPASSSKPLSSESSSDLS